MQTNNIVRSTGGGEGKDERPGKSKTEYHLNTDSDSGFTCNANAQFSSGEQSPSGVI